VLLRTRRVPTALSVSCTASGASNLVSHFGFGGPPSRRCPTPAGRLASPFFRPWSTSGRPTTKPLPHLPPRRTCSPQDKPGECGASTTCGSSPRAPARRPFATRFRLLVARLDYAHGRRGPLQGPQPGALHFRQRRGHPERLGDQSGPFAKVLAEAVRADGTTFPWAVRSANFHLTSARIPLQLHERGRTGSSYTSDLLFRRAGAGPPPSGNRAAGGAWRTSAPTVMSPSSKVVVTELSLLADTIPLRLRPWCRGLSTIPRASTTTAAPSGSACRTTQAHGSALLKKHAHPTAGTMVMHGNNPPVGTRPSNPVHPGQRRRLRVLPGHREHRSTP